MHIHRSVATKMAKPVTFAGRDSEIGLLPDRSRPVRSGLVKPVRNSIDAIVA
jgi:hypothetical protein